MLFFDDTDFPCDVWVLSGSDVEVLFDLPTDLTEGAPVEYIRDGGVLVSAEVLRDFSDHPSWFWANNTILCAWMGECSSCIDEVSEWLSSSPLNIFIRVTAEVLERERDPYGVKKINK